MYFLKTNKFNSLLSLILSLAMVLSMSIASVAEQPLQYGNYPVLRGTTNPQEIATDYTIKDAGAKLREMTFASIIGVIKPVKGITKPNETLNNQKLIDAFAKIQGQTEPIEDYNAKAVELGMITEEELAKPENANFLTRPVTMRELNKNFGKVIGVETKYNTSVNQQARRVDLANLIYANKDYFLNKSGIKEYAGEVLNKSKIVENGLNKIIATIKLDKNMVIDKETMKNLQGNGGNNQNANEQTPGITQVDKIVPDNLNSSTVISYLNIISNKDVAILTPQGFTTDMNRIVSGSGINIYTKNNSILYAEQYTKSTGQIAGVLESITLNNKDYLTQSQGTAENYTNVVKITDYDNVAHIYKMHPDVNILQVSSEIGDTTGISKPVTQDQLNFGQDVLLELRDDIVTAIKAYVPVEPELNSYVPPESQLSAGTVLDISADHITLTNNVTYPISSSTPILKGGELATYDKIKDGDRIKLYFDDIYSAVPSKIEVEGSQRQAGAILKAKVGPYSIIKKGLTLKNVKEFVDGVWIDATGDTLKQYENIKINGSIYANAKKIQPNNLKTYNNQEIYAVVAKNQGIPTIQQAKIRQGNSLIFNNSIKNVDHSQNTLQIDNNLVKFDDSTIFIKDGNIVQSANLQTGINTSIETNMLKDAQIVIQNGSGINFENIKAYPYKIYRATLRDVFDYSILLGNDIENNRKVNHFFLWQGGKWSRYSQDATTPRLNFTEQTKIYDHDNDMAITIDQMREKKYALNTFGIRPEYFNRQVYVVTKDDVVVSIDLIKAQGYVDVNSQNTIVAKGVGTYEQATTDTNTANQAGNKAGNQTATTSSIKPVLVKDINEYNASKNMLQYAKPVTTTDTKTQQIKQTPVRKLIDITKASVIYNGKVIDKTATDTLKDKNLTIVFRQNRDRKTKDGMEILEAVTVIAE